MRWLAIAAALLVGCNRFPAAGHDDQGSQSDESQHEGPACESDDDCAFVPSGCCEGCFGGHPRQMTTRTRADLRESLDALTCWTKECPYVMCVTNPPCTPRHEPACERGRCVAAPVLPDGCSDCIDACGPFPPEGLDCDPHDAEDLWVACCNATRDDPDAIVDCSLASHCRVDDASGYPPALIKACETAPTTR